MLFSGLAIAPPIMPEVITGISSLRFFIMQAEWIGWPGQRGFTTVTLALITFSMVFVTTVIQARMIQVDRAIEEVAMACTRALGRSSAFRWRGPASS